MLEFRPFYADDESAVRTSPSMDPRRNKKAFPLMEPSFARWMIRVLINWVEVVALFLAMAWLHHPVGYVLGVILLATRQHALSIMAHDGAHRAISRNHAFNDLVTCIFTFWALGIGLDGYRKFHFEHHAKVGTEADPELIHKRWARPEWALPLTRTRLFFYVLKDLVGFAVVDIIRLIRIVKPVSVLDRIGPVLLWLPVLAVMYFTHTLWIAAVWWISVNTAYWAIFRLRIWTEHTGTNDVHRITARGWQRFLFQPHNTWCHHEHHLWPSIPCWNLPHARKLVSQPSPQTIGSLFSDYENAPSMPYGLPSSTTNSKSKPFRQVG